MILNIKDFHTFKELCPETVQSGEVGVGDIKLYVACWLCSNVCQFQSAVALANSPYVQV